MSNALITIDDDSLIEITPVVKDEEGAGTAVSHGQPVQIKLSDLVAYLQTKTGWTA